MNSTVVHLHRPTANKLSNMLNMKQCFRVALWLFLLTGYLQARPAGSNKKALCKLDPNDFDFSNLRNIPCNNTVTFKSPENVQEQCYAAALEVFRDGLEDAIKNCESPHEIYWTKKALELDCLPNTTCNLTMTVHETFESFVTATETFTEQLNTSQGQQ